MHAESKPYIIIAQQEWALDLGSNARNLAMEISKDRPVLYINPAMDIKSVFRQIKTPHGQLRFRKALSFKNNTIKVSENLWIHTPSTLFYSINWIKNIYIYNFFNKRNAKDFFKSLRKAITALGWKNDNCIVLNDSQMFTGLFVKMYLQPLLSFYYIRDNLIEHPYFKYHGSRIEPLTITCADAVFANSAYLTEYAKNYNDLSINIGQGCELNMYNAKRKNDVPDDFKKIPNPRIGYIGFLTGERLDIQLLEQLALQKKEWSWVYIGPEEIMFKQSKLHDMANVYFLGTKKPALLPGYIQHLNVCLNPQLLNPLTIGNYPRKIDEYLAMGQPVVATQTPAMQMFEPYVQLSNGAEEYKTAIERALIPQSQEKISAAISFAKSHTWQACIEKIYGVQNQLLHV